MAYNLLIHGTYWGYNPLTKLLLTSWDIQAVSPAADNPTSPDLIAVDSKGSRSNIPLVDRCWNINYHSSPTLKQRWGGKDQVSLRPLVVEFIKGIVRLPSFMELCKNNSLRIPIGKPV